MASKTLDNPFFVKFTLTKIQRLTFEYIAKRIRKTGKGVTYRDIQYQFGYTNKVTPFEIVARLELRGYLHRLRGWNTIILAEKPPIDAPLELAHEWRITNLESFYG